MKPRYAFLALAAAAALATSLLAASFLDRTARADSARKQVAYLGATLADLSHEARVVSGLKQGVLIIAIDPDSPADKEGLREGDIITEFEGQDVTAAYQVYGKIRQMRVGELARVRIWRDGTERATTLVQLGGIEYGTPASGGAADPELVDRMERLEREIVSLQHRVEALERAGR